MDQAIDGHVSILVGDRKVPAPKNMSGVCIGEGTTVGSGVWIAPGRAVGAGLKIVREAVLTDPRCKADETAVYVVTGGKLDKK
jgi:acetyltransferase-like isoleucine patch superfamily enzyme